MKYLALFLLTFLAMFPTNAQWTPNGNNITTTNNVGIGTINPIYAKVQIRGGATHQLLALNRPDNDVPALYLGNDGSDNAAIAANNSDLTFGRNLGGSYTEHMRIQNSGNVGIGTTNPIFAKIQVRGGATHQLLALNRPDNDVPALYLGNDGSDNAAIAANNSDLTFGKDLGGSYTEHMRIQNSGNVGIGTSSPDSKLAVNGVIHSKEVRVDLIGWPDYVFKKQYYLPSLEEVEDHIKQKGHLKDIPSAQEVLENGIFLGDMNAKLLQKIEELTLYTIQQQKEIQSLKKENGELKSISTRLAEIEKLIELKN
nr:hypothetical protein [uncultured Allomuricauda sp.]